MPSGITLAFWGQLTAASAGTPSRCPGPGDLGLRQLADEEEQKAREAREKARLDYLDGTDDDYNEED